MSHTKSICMIGLSIAIIAVSAWITIPIGPIPFTLQMFAIPLAIYLLRPSQSIIAIYLYVFFGAMGLPIFSGMRGGIGVLLGPTGGFLLGYLIGVPLAALLLHIVRGRSSAVDLGKGALESEGFSVKLLRSIKSGGWEFLAGLIFIFFAYAVGCIRYMAVANVDLAVALAACALPFIIPDIVKTVLAIFSSQLIKASLSKDIGKLFVTC